MTALHPLVAETTRQALSLSAALYEAQEAQWQRSVVLAPDDGEEAAAGGSLMSRGQHSDPTFDTVADEVRQSLRAAVVRAEGALRSAQHQLRTAEDGLHAALDKWNGGL